MKKTHYFFYFKAGIKGVVYTTHFASNDGEETPSSSFWMVPGTWADEDFD